MTLQAGHLIGARPDWRGQSRLAGKRSNRLSGTARHLAEPSDSGRTLEAIDYLERFLERGEKIPEAERHPVGRVGIFNRPTDVTWDSKDNIYVADRNNWRIQVYDTELTLKKTIVGMGSPWGICVTPGSPQYLFSGDGTTGKLYKMDMDGKLLGWAQTSLGQGEDDAGRLIWPCRVPNGVVCGVLRGPHPGRTDHGVSHGTHARDFLLTVPSRGR